VNEWISCEQTNKLYIDGRLKPENVQQNLIDGIFSVASCQLTTRLDMLATLILAI
jgi:hypothetical protein